MVCSPAVQYTVYRTVRFLALPTARLNQEQGMHGTLCTALGQTGCVQTWAAPSCQPPKHKCTWECAVTQQVGCFPALWLALLPVVMFVKLAIHAHAAVCQD